MQQQKQKAPTAERIRLRVRKELNTSAITYPRRVEIKHTSYYF